MTDSPPRRKDVLSVGRECRMRGGRQVDEIGFSQLGESVDMMTSIEIYMCICIRADSRMGGCVSGWVGMREGG